MDPYIHTVPITTEQRVSHSDSTRIEHYVLRGTTEQIVAHVGKVLTNHLEDRSTTRFELTPIAPHSIIDFAKWGES